jgi:NADH-quinone oxidoreductase subunit M
MTKEYLGHILDLSLREKLVFAPLILLVLWMGIYPMSFLNPMSDAVRNLVQNYKVATATAAGVVRQAAAGE